MHHRQLQAKLVKALGMVKALRMVRAHELFEKLDTDADGRVTLEEWNAYLEEKAGEKGDEGQFRLMSVLHTLRTHMIQAQLVKQVKQKMKAASSAANALKSDYKEFLLGCRDDCCINGICKHTQGETGKSKHRLDKNAKNDVNEAVDERDATMIVVALSKPASKLLRLASDAHQVVNGSGPSL